jgi:hypothetical protein
MSRRRVRDFRRQLDLKLDKMRPPAPLCPWCQYPDKRPKCFSNGSHEAKRLLRRGRVRMASIQRQGSISITKTVCAHICHEG